MVGRLDLQDFKEQAERRREKAQHYPNEERNLEAAAILDRLAATVDAIPQDVFVALSELGPNVDDDLLDVERCGCVGEEAIANSALRAWSRVMRVAPFNSQ